MDIYFEDLTETNRVYSELKNKCHSESQQIVCSREFELVTKLHDSLLGK